MVINKDDLSPEVLDEFLEHFGVKGMRWGVRRNRSAQNTSEGVDPTKAAKKMSDHELKQAVERLRLEKQYVDMMRGESSSPQRSAGKDFANSILKDSGNRLIGALVGGVATLAVEQILGGKIKSAAAANAAKAAARAAGK